LAPLRKPRSSVLVSRFRSPLKVAGSLRVEITRFPPRGIAPALSVVGLFAGGVVAVDGPAQAARRGPRTSRAHMAGMERACLVKT
jgi:hypothetical protein